MNASTPPSRKVAKPKSKSLPRATRTAPVADTPSVPAAPVAETNAPVAPETPAAPVEKPAFIEGEANDSRKSGKRHHHKWQNKHHHPKPTAAAPAPAEPASAAEQESAEMGPQTRHLTLLGNKTVYSDRYTPAILEAFDNRHPENDYFVKFNCPEFTSLCPITGQPDFATIYISYIPDKKMVESKSLKLYLFSFRNHGAFHEDCVNLIMKDLIKLMSPRYIEVWGKFLPRGGLSIDPYANYGRPTTRWEEFARQRLLMHDLTPERVDNR